MILILVLDVDIDGTNDFDIGRLTLMILTILHMRWIWLVDWLFVGYLVDIYK